MFAPLVALVFAGLVAAQSTIPGCARDYTVQEGDYCDAISAAHNSSTYQLAVSNYKTINDGCTNLVPGQNICLGKTDADCTTTYVVQAGDWCDLIASNHGINSTLLMTNNPEINDKCSNLYVGQVLCVANQVLVTPPPEGWTIPHSSHDDGDATGDNSASTSIPSTTTTSATTTTASAITFTQASSESTSGDNTSEDNNASDDTKSSDDTKDSEGDDSEDDYDCDDN